MFPQVSLPSPMAPRGVHIDVDAASSAGLPEVSKREAFFCEEEPSQLLGGDFSIRASLEGAVVLLTGCTGYVGSLVLEQLLRCCPGVTKIYVLARQSRGVTAEDRISRLLCTGLFHLVRDRPELLAKVVVLNGDLGQEGLGIAPDVLEGVIADTTAVIHSAASIALDAPIQTTLKYNYCGTQALLQLALSFRRLTSFVHVSTAYVNMHRGGTSTQLEQIYPLMQGDHKVDHAALVSTLMSLDTKSAEVKAKACMQLWGFKNTYSMGKHLTEQMVATYHGRVAPIAIVRPVLVSAVAKLPCPGYVGNPSGFSGFMLAFALGLLNKNSLAWRSSHIWDCVPGDVVSSLVVASAAANVTQPSRKAPLILHAATSTVNPMTHLEAYGISCQYLQRYPMRYKLGEYWELHELKDEYIPEPWKMWWAQCIMAFKVKLACFLLCLFNLSAMARKLETGYRAWMNINRSKFDISLLFSVEGALGLEAQLVAEERDDFMLTWRGNWNKFQTTYMVGLLHKYLGQAPPPASEVPHDYLLIEDRKPAAVAAAASSPSSAAPFKSE